jgi:tRNA nucleotidyltransferase/poly(A) polymerase
MLHFDALHVLADHSVFMQKKIKHDDVFLVGGCIRDLLLGTVEKPLDIDLALATDPKVLYKKIDTVGLSHFMTEKYGTITLLPKSGDFHGVKYEITPFRTE